MKRCARRSVVFLGRGLKFKSLRDFGLLIPREATGAAAPHSELVVNLQVRQISHTKTMFHAWPPEIGT
jgi:hypothetical protein